MILSFLPQVTHINTSARNSQRLSPQKTSKVASPTAKTPDPVKKGNRNEMVCTRCVIVLIFIWLVHFQCYC